MLFIQILVKLSYFYFYYFIYLYAVILFLNKYMVSYKTDIIKNVVGQLKKSAFNNDLI